MDSIEARINRLLDQLEDEENPSKIEQIKDKIAYLQEQNQQS
jgi:hypothetical protein